MFSPELAAEVLNAVLATQREDGFIAHEVSPADMSDVTQPPLLAWAYWTLHRSTGARSLVQRCYEQIVRFVEWVLANRRAGDTGLVAWKTSEDPLCRCGESGMDNSPRFDDPGTSGLAAVDFNSYLVNEMKCLAEMALVLRRFGEAAEWKERSQRLSGKLSELLWDETDGFYYDLTVRGDRLRLKTSVGFLPLFAGACDDRQAARLIEHLEDPNEFRTAFPVPSVARNEPCYELDMWRGPTWLNIDLLIVEGLRRYGRNDAARDLTMKILAGVEDWYARLGSIFEYYDPDGEVPPTELDRKKRLKTGKGIAPISDYSWSAACYLALAAQAQ
jgi:glycogen debranching enzyme